jgi:hypothetical protein
MVEEKGVESIIFRHPELLYVIENINKVNTEVLQWI